MINVMMILNKNVVKSLIFITVYLVLLFKDMNVSDNSEININVNDSPFNN